MSEQAKRAYEAHARVTEGCVSPTWQELPARQKEGWRQAVASAIDSPPRAPESLTEKQMRLLHESGVAGLAKVLGKLMPPGRGFILLTVDYGEGADVRSIAYASSVDQDDVVRILREFLEVKGAL